MCVYSVSGRARARLLGRTAGAQWLNQEGNGFLTGRSARRELWSVARGVPLVVLTSGPTGAAPVRGLSHNGKGAPGKARAPSP